MEGKTFCDGLEPFILRFFSYAELASEFGGHALLYDGTADQHYVGLWGKKKVSRFRRLMRERGAQFELVRLSSPVREVRSYSKTYSAYHEARLARSRHAWMSL
ncbi:MAG TPA: hypothetical protein VFO25_01660 [Candidatus Eremiobacteraceae bacterium]|nr:hypothetical protein [Candidatus Eremiobacteraceae bacterium]